MFAQFTRSLPRLTLVLACSLAPLVACSGGGTGDQGSPSTNSSSSLDCSGQVQPELGPGAVCADSQVRPNGLMTFDNWGGHKYAADDFDYATMAAIFGDSFVCGKTAVEQCTVTSDAVVASDFLNELISGGRCEGLAVLGALYATGRGPDPSTYKADGIGQLSPINDLFANVIDYWWASQFLSGTIDASATTRALSMDDLVSFVADGLTKKVGLTMGLYFDGRGHSVLPLAITKTSATTYSIVIWDSNAPLETRFVDIDTSSQTWSFKNGSVNSDTPSEIWSGGVGSIDAADLTSRVGDPILGSDEGRGGSTVIATSAAGQSLTMTITLDDARKIVASATGVTGAADGIATSTVKSGDSVQYVITLPSNAGSFDIEATTLPNSPTNSTTSTVQTSSTIAIVNPGSGAVSVNIPSSSVATATENETVTSIKSVASDAENTNAFSVSSNTAVNVQASAKNSVISLPLSPNELASIAPSIEDGVDAVITVSANGIEQSTTINSPTSNQTVQETAIVRGGDGNLITTSSVLPSITIDPSAYENLKAAVNSETGSGTSDDTSRLSDVAKQTSLTTNTSEITKSSSQVIGRISASVAGSAIVEYSPDNDRSQTLSTATQPFEKGLDQQIRFSLSGLNSGTTYRYRLKADIDGNAVYSPWGVFNTQSDPVTDGSALLNQVIIGDLSSQIFASSAVISTRIMSPVNAAAFVEYRQTDQTEVQVKPSQIVQGGRERLLAFAVNELQLGLQYTARIGVKIGDVVKYSNAIVFTTQDTGPSSPTATITTDFQQSLTIGATTSSSAQIGITISSQSGGKVQLEYQTDSSASLGGAPSKSALVTVASGKLVRVWVALRDLLPNQRYIVRPIFLPSGSNGGLPTYGTNFKFVTKANTESNNSGETNAPTTTSPPNPSGSDLADLINLSVSNIENTGVTVTALIPTEGTPANFSGFINLEYGLDQVDIDAAQWPVAISISNGSPSNPTFNITNLDSGLRYRVRAVLTSSTGEVSRTAFSTFTTTGSVSDDLYRPIIETPIRISGGLHVSWARPNLIVPSPANFEVQVDGVVATIVAGTELETDLTGITVGSHSLTVVAMLPSGQRVSSLPTNFNIGSGPFISSFSFVSATSNSLLFNFSFNPFGDTVAYGVQVSTLADQLVRAEQGGSTSNAVSGQSLQVSQLTSGSQYKARLVIFVGQQMYTSDWVYISTL